MVPLESKLLADVNILENNFGREETSPTLFFTPSQKD